MPERLTIKESVEYLKKVHGIEIKLSTFKNWCGAKKVPAEKTGNLYLISKEILDKIGKNFEGHQKGGRPKWALADKQPALIAALLKQAKSL